MDKELKMRAIWCSTRSSAVELQELPPILRAASSWVANSMSNFMPFKSSATTPNAPIRLPTRT